LKKLNAFLEGKVWLCSGFGVGGGGGGGFGNNASKGGEKEKKATSVVERRGDRGAGFSELGVSIFERVTRFERGEGQLSKKKV